MKRICIFGDSVTWGMGLSGRVDWWFNKKELIKLVAEKPKQFVTSMKDYI